MKICPLVISLRIKSPTVGNFASEAMEFRTALPFLLCVDCSIGFASPDNAANVSRQRATHGLFHFLQLGDVFVESVAFLLVDKIGVFVLRVSPHFVAPLLGLREVDADSVVNPVQPVRLLHVDHSDEHPVSPVENQVLFIPLHEDNMQE